MVTTATDKDRLVEIPRTQWPRLCDMYRRDWPANIIGCYTVDTFLRWTEQSIINNLTIYSLNDDWTDDGTYVCVHRYQVFANTLHPASDRLQRALRLLPNWSHGYKVSTLCDRFRPAVQSIISERQFSYEFDSMTRLYYLPKERATELDLTPPPGIHLQSLRAEHVQPINDLWPNHHPGSLFFIGQIIALSPSVGAFTEDGQLVAWCLRLQAGPHGVLQVLDSHKRRGLGLLVLKALARKLAALGLDSCAAVGPENVPSVKSFEKAGFEVIDSVHWMRTNATDPIEWSDS